MKLLTEIKWSLSGETIWTLDSEEFDTEYDLWLETMEAAMKRLDQEGVFDINQERDDVIVLVEVMLLGYTKELLRNYS